MKPELWRNRYDHIPRDFPRRVRVLQDLWGLNCSDFGWRLGLNLSYVKRYRQGLAMPTLAQVSKMEHACGLPAVDYLMACPASRAPRKPKEHTGVKGPGKFEKMWRQVRQKGKKKRMLFLEGGELGYEGKAMFQQKPRVPA